MNKNIKHYVRNCSICQRNKSDNAAYPGLLQPLPIPEAVWEATNMDFIEGLPTSTQHFTSILVVIDCLSKYAHFMPLKHPYSALDVAQVYLDNVFKLHGFPKSIVSDQDPLFFSATWQELFRLHGVQLNFSITYHPQCDGQIEATNRTLETYLRCMCSENPKSWSSWLPLAEWWYNTTHHTLIKALPYEILYGQPPPIYMPYLPGESSVVAVDRSLQKREEMI